ncbi:DUF4126 domain-containing protein [Nocardioides sp. KR10-350]|uniref:DUF4126 domain-containing protein n=1 Tax=Nocardioides cheoyonin TaxID=3156615 RepID=UPI0032B3FE2D
MDALALTFSSGWASGINAYLVVLVLGIADRVADLQQVPDALGSWPVLIAAAVLYVWEFVADKIPYVDSAWDSVSTVIRPTIGAVIGVLLAGEATSLDDAVGGVVGGGSALASHLVKAGNRLALNASPEPVTNVTASGVEDLGVLGVVWLATEHPVAAAIIAAVLLVLGLVVLVLLFRLVRKGWRRWKGKDRPLPAPG